MKKTASGCKLILLLPACMVIFVTCHKEYSNEGGAAKPTAVYTLVGAGGACTGSVLAGNYYIGKALTAASTIQLQVNVTTVGSYNISTNTANGFYFSTAGTFVQTGTQNIILTANGTPVATGNFSFTAATVAGCSFSVIVGTEPVAMASFITDCKSVRANGQFRTGIKLTISQSITFDINVTAVGAYSISTDTLDGFYFYASGVFSSTGSKTITLNGNGMPVAARNLLFTLKGSSSPCTINVTVTDADPLAVYVLESGFGTPNPCVYTINGMYTSNTALTSSSTVKISVYVTAAGNFTIATATINGIIFSYSGQFTTLGAQTVVLTGSGTPTASGTFSFAPEIVGPHPLGGQSCAFSIKVQ